MVRKLWKELCECFEYRFFTGIPFEGSSDLYSAMDSEIMHYVPAANELIALRMASGARVSGFKSGVLLEPLKINRLDMGFNIEFEIPILIITSVKDILLRKGLYRDSSLSKVVAYIEKNKKPGVFLLE